jgi:hypothetical protein
MLPLSRNHESLSGVRAGTQGKITSARSAQPRDPHNRLMNAIVQMAGDGTYILSSHSRPWASATFIGAQHQVTLKMTETAEAATLDAFLAALPDAEFHVPGHIVADVAVDSRLTTQTEKGRETEIRLCALTIEDW